jgi:hypothetical protein
VDRGERLRPFDRESYQELLTCLISAGYRWTFFTDRERKPQRAEVYLRHDVDFDPRYARAMAELEHELGVTSTYFFHLRSVAYNLLDVAVVDSVRAIAAAGHHIGLHFDQSHYRRELADEVERELAIFSSYIDSPEAAIFVNKEVISFHRPRKSSFGRRVPFLPPNLGHAFERRYMSFEGRKMFFSDSGCRWGEDGDPRDWFELGSQHPIQILTHPIWWMEQGGSPDEKVVRFFKSRSIPVAQVLSTWNVAEMLPSLEDFLLPHHSAGSSDVEPAPTR